MNGELLEHLNLAARTCVPRVHLLICVTQAPLSAQLPANVNGGEKGKPKFGCYDRNCSTWNAYGTDWNYHSWSARLVDYALAGIQFMHGSK